MTAARAVGGVTAILGLTLLVAGCSGSAGGASSAEHSAAASAVTGGLAGDSTAGSAGAAAGGVTATAPAGATDVAALAPTSLILSGSVSLTVARNADVDRAATRATGIADAAGGRVDADTRSSGTQHSATLVLRVPNAALPSVRRQLAALGTVRGQNLQTRDVTTEVADVDSRVTSARAAIAALNRLYAKAQTVRDLITVESALAGRQSDLEALEAQQRTLAAQTSLATVTLSIDVRAPAAAKRHHDRGGFLHGLRGGWHAFTSAAYALATGAGATLPFVALALVIGAGVLIGLRRRHRPSPRVDPAA